MNLHQDDNPGIRRRQARHQRRTDLDSQPHRRWCQRPPAYEAGTAADYIASIEPARKQGAPEGSGNNPQGRAGKQEETKRANCEFSSGGKPKRKPGKSNGDPERIIARLKRDANDGNTQAAALVRSLEPIG